MLKLTAELKTGGHLYVFGLSKENLDRLKDEPIFFDFGYVGQPHLYGLILYLVEFGDPKTRNVSLMKEAVAQKCLPYFDRYGVDAETLRIFAISPSILRKLKAKEFWAFESFVEINSKYDQQVFFSGTTEDEMAEHFKAKGLISPQTKKYYKGFQEK